MWQKKHVSHFVFIFILCLCRYEAKILRNNALMDKLVSKFHSRDNNLSTEKTEKEDIQQPEEQNTEQLEPRQPEQVKNIDQPSYDTEVEQPIEKSLPIKQSNLGQSNVLNMMQNVLCKNFPTIPCDMITKDDTLKHLIQKSVSQIDYKGLNNKNINQLFGQQTQPPIGHLTFFPTVDSEDLSNFLLVRDPTNLFTPKKASLNNPGRKHKKKHKKNSEDGRQRKNRKKQILNSKDTGSVVEGSRKKIRKFYPHKLKGLASHAAKHSLPTYSEERTSMSVEVPDTGVIRKRRLPVHVDEEYPPVWRIDYLKQGDPTLAQIDHDNDYFQGKITKTGDNVIVDENVLEPASRRDVLHPDLYIKKNYGKKSPSTSIL